ncbi:MAG TPA: GNAT family N-acetyltransferase [Anaerolineae bacterium]|nr:GNAT family N-acetyltransferase [Anaerolineae bacterium]
MNISKSQIAELERVNYAATAAIAEVTPGLDLWLRDDIIITSNEFFPYVDVTHACLLQATPQTVDKLITEIIAYFQSKGLPPNIFVSPACTPPNLAERLVQRGFAPQKEVEAWLVFEHLLDFAVPSLSPKIAVEQITKANVCTLIKTMLAAFELPGELEPFMVQLTEPSVGLPGIFHFVAWLDDQPIGTCSLICYQNVGILGGVGVVPAHRGSKAVTNLIYRAGQIAQEQGVDMLLLQTVAGTLLERLLRIGGFKRMFTRTAYTLVNGQLG